MHRLRMRQSRRVIEHRRAQAIGGLEFFQPVRGGFGFEHCGDFSVDFGGDRYTRGLARATRIVLPFVVADDAGNAEKHVAIECGKVDVAVTVAKVPDGTTGAFDDAAISVESSAIICRAATQGSAGNSPPL